MESLLKKFIYTGVGLVSLTAEKLHQSINDLVKQGKISEDEGRKVIDEIITETEAKRGEFEQRIRSVVEKVVDKVDFPGYSEFHALTERVEALEARLGIGGDKKASVKKVSPRKTKAKATFGAETTEENIN